MYTKLYDIKSTNAYQDAESVYVLIPDDRKFQIEKLICREVYVALLFNYNVVRKIEDYYCKFFEVGEHGFSYQLGCYFQSREYKSDGFIESDIDRFNSLIRVYNSEKYPKEYKLLQELVKDLQWFLAMWRNFEQYYPELFEGDGRIKEKGD